MEFVEIEVRSHPMTNQNVKRNNITGLHETMLDMLRPLVSASEACFNVCPEVREERP